MSAAQVRLSGKLIRNGLLLRADRTCYRSGGGARAAQPGAREQFQRVRQEQQQAEQRHGRVARGEERQARGRDGGQQPGEGAWRPRGNRITLKRMTGLICGVVTWRSCCHGPAPRRSALVERLRELAAIGADQLAPPWLSGPALALAGLRVVSGNTRETGQFGHEQVPPLSPPMT